jgi:hypothetical protein
MMTKASQQEMQVEYCMIVLYWHILNTYHIILCILQQISTIYYVYYVYILKTNCEP